MNERIEVTVNINEYPEGWHLSPAMWESFVVGKLKAAGIPIEGTLVFRGIKSGKLIKFDDPKDYAVAKYIWISSDMESLNHVEG